MEPQRAAYIFIKNEKITAYMSVKRSKNILNVKITNYLLI